MGTAVPRALGEAQMRLLAQVIDPLGGELTNGLGQQPGVVRDPDLLRDLPLRQLGGVQHMRFVLDQGPFEGFLRAVDIDAFPVLAGDIKEGAVDTG